MYKGKSFIVISSTIVALLLWINVEAVPMKRLSRMVREVYPEIEPENEGNQAQVCIVGDVVYGMDETVPADQPCLKCKCQPPGVQCETIQCAKRPGCKAIHKPNKCCPEYQCECEHNGKIYANGEKLETPPGGECKVCYCRGGEVQCAEVSCYIRTDCEGKRVPGTCCPKYDHCPPIDPIPNRPVYTTDIIISNKKDQFELWPITVAPSNSTEGILGPTQNDFQEENKIPDTNSYDTTTPNYPQIELTDAHKDTVTISRITIQEIIPERKEIPITAPPKTEIEPQGTLLIEEAEEFANNSNDLVITDTDTDSSEISETFQQPPPVLKVGDKLLFLKKGEFVHEKDATEPSSVITVVGAEGLQRGGIDDSAEVHEVKIENTPINDSGAENNTATVEENAEEENDTLSLNTAASTHILSLVKRKNKPPSSTTQASTTQAASEETFLNTTEVSSTTTNEEPSNDTVSDINDSIETPTTINTMEVMITEEVKQSSESSSTLSTVKHLEVVTEQNPAYPPIPEIMSPNMDDTSQRFDTENAENTTGNIETKILPEVLEIRSNKTFPQNITNSEWLKNIQKTLLNPNAVLPEDLLKQKAPTDAEESTQSSNIPEATTISEVITTIDFDVKIDNSTTVETSLQEVRRSIEVMEDSSEGSKEVTTPKNSHASLVSNEDASIEVDNNPSGEANDMVDVKEKNDDSNMEKTTIRGIIDNVNENKKNDTETKPIDVEFVDTSTLQKPKTNVEKSTSSQDIPESLPKPEKLKNEPLKIIKRESSLEEEEEDEEETSEEQTEKSLGSDEEQREADAIFRELLEDTSTSKPSAAQNREIETLSRVSNALEQLSLKGRTPDTNILGILSNFFSTQYRE